MTFILDKQFPFYMCVYVPFSHSINWTKQVLLFWGWLNFIVTFVQEMGIDDHLIIREIVVELLCFSETFWDVNFFFYCSEFCHTLKWNSHGFTCVPHPDPPETWIYYIKVCSFLNSIKIFLQCENLILDIIHVLIIKISWTLNFAVCFKLLS